MDGTPRYKTPGILRADRNSDFAARRHLQNGWAGGKARIRRATEKVGGQGSFTPERLPVCDKLESALRLASAGPAPIPELAAVLNSLSPRMQWRRRNSSTPDGTTFHHGHANALVAGPGSLEEREDVWVGISLLAPQVCYPYHRHYPEEVYVSLAGGAWWNANMEWITPGPGGLIYNEPNVLHAMRTEAQPLLAIWCLLVGS